MSLFAKSTTPILRPELVVSWREIIGVLLVLLAPFGAMSALAASHGSQHTYVQTFLSDRKLLLNAAAEAAILGLALVYLNLRGWKPADLRIRPGLWSFLQGVLLVPVILLANSLVVLTLFVLTYLGQHRYPTFLAFILANSPDIRHLNAHQLSWPVLIAAMILNAFLEEIICTAYAFCEFTAKLGPTLGLLLIVLVRVACHTYQGPIHAAGIGAVFLIFGLWYRRTRNLWTLIFAHALLDLSSLSALKLLSH